MSRGLGIAQLKNHEEIDNTLVMDIFCENYFDLQLFREGRKTTVLRIKVSVQIHFSSCLLLNLNLFLQWKMMYNLSKRMFLPTILFYNQANWYHINIMCLAPETDSWLRLYMVQVWSVVSCGFPTMHFSENKTVQDLSNKSNKCTWWQSISAWFLDKLIL